MRPVHSDQAIRREADDNNMVCRNLKVSHHDPSKIALLTSIYGLANNKRGRVHDYLDTQKKER